MTMAEKGYKPTVRAAKIPSLKKKNSCFPTFPDTFISFKAPFEATVGKEIISKKAK